MSRRTKDNRTAESPGRVRSKADLPAKICAACGRPFAWRKKWARDWSNVRYCSERCRRAKAAPEKSPSAPANSAD